MNIFTYDYIATVLMTVNE